MSYETIGFIGGGRVTCIILTALNRAGKLPGTVVVSDSNAGVLAQPQRDIPSIVTDCADNTKPAACNLVFVSLHPPAIAEALDKIKSSLNKDAVVVSLAPKLSIAKLSRMLGGHSKIVRMIPNAPSIVNQGYNPIVFSGEISAAEKGSLLDIFSVGHFNKKSQAITVSSSPAQSSAAGKYSLSSCVSSLARRMRLPTVLRRNSDSLSSNRISGSAGAQGLILS